MHFLLPYHAHASFDSLKWLLADLCYIQVIDEAEIFNNELDKFVVATRALLKQMLTCMHLDNYFLP